MRPIEIGIKYIGKQETAGQNRGPIIDKWCDDLSVARGSSWCAIFCGHCILEAYSLFNKSILRQRLGFSSPFFVDVAEAWRKQLKSLGSKTESPEPGDVGFVIDSSGKAVHMFFVTSNISNGSVTTLEGNSNNNGSRNGDSVCQHKRFAGPNVEFFTLNDKCKEQ